MLGLHFVEHLEAVVDERRPRLAGRCRPLRFLRRRGRAGRGPARDVIPVQDELTGFGGTARPRRRRAGGLRARPALLEGLGRGEFRRLRAAKHGAEAARERPRLGRPLVLGRERRRHGADDGLGPSFVALPRDDRDDGERADEEERVERREEPLRGRLRVERRDERRTLRRDTFSGGGAPMASVFGPRRATLASWRPSWCLRRARCCPRNLSAATTRRAHGGSGGPRHVEERDGPRARNRRQLGDASSPPGGGLAPPLGRPWG